MSCEKKGSTQVLGFLEEQAMKQIQKSISSGKNATINKMLEHYGKEGLEEYLLGRHLNVQSKVDPTLAKKYYMISADKGHALGQIKMALIYFRGTHGTEKDEEMFIKLTKLSANQGCPSALYNRAEWLLNGTMAHMGLETNPKKAYKLLGKAKKGPLLDIDTGLEVDIYILLAQMRLQGNGCTKNPKSALEYLHAVERLQPGKFSKEVFDMTQLIVGLSPVSCLRESDLRWRRLKVAVRSVGRQTLDFWENLHGHYGMKFSISPSSTGDGDMVVNFCEMQEWKTRVGCIDKLPETYPAMGELLPPLECNNSACDVDETQIKRSMKKCSECQAPYCSETCQRADWRKHKPVCNAISARINDDTDQDKENPELKGLGLAQTELYKVLGRKELTDADKEAAYRLGFQIPNELQ